MTKPALPSLTASVLLHLALSFGIGVESLRVSRAPLLPSRPAEFELVPLEPALESDVEREAAAGVGSELATGLPRAVPAARRSADSQTPWSAPAARAPSAAQPHALAEPSSVPPSAAVPSAAAQVTSEPAHAAPAAAESASVEPSAPPSSVAEPSASEPSTTLQALGASASGRSGSAAGSASSGGRPAAGATSGGAPLAGSSGADPRALRAAYLEELRRRVLGHRVYPYLARRARLEGTVCLRVSLDGQGRVARLQATCAAPAPLLEAAFAAVRTAAPFGPLPSSAGDELTVDLPMVFQLEAM